MTARRSPVSRSTPLLLGGALLCALVGSTALAQSSVQGVPNAVQGFSVNRDQPIQIEATTLEVRDKESIATFSGNVHVIQGDTHMRSKTLKVFYDQQGGKQTGPSRPAPAATPGPGGQQQIQKLEAGGGVVVIQKDQKASGDAGIFDTKSNQVTLKGNVVITQGQNTLRGDRLIVNLQTGVSRMESDTGRVQGVFSSGPPGANPAATPGAHPLQQPAREMPRPGLPRTRLN
jgi:lipopolysaccharide export system protein LptA